MLMAEPKELTVYPHREKQNQARKQKKKEIYFFY